MAEIEFERQQEPARLRIYLGAAPGVGKTYHMINDAVLKRKQGVDVVIGLVETHGRQDTADQIRDLEIVHPARDSLSRRRLERKWSVERDSCATSAVSRGRRVGAHKCSRQQESQAL